MGSFDPNSYETVKSRKLRFYADHPDGRIWVNTVNIDFEEKAVMCAKVFLNKDDQEKNLPRGTGFALELRDKTLSRTDRGKEYESVNYTSWLENAEESAVGRALDNAGYASNARCSLDEMEKAARNAKAVSSTLPKPNTQASAAPRTTSPGGSGVFCELCGTELGLSKKGGHYYCKNFKDTSKGEHTSIPVADLDAFKAYQASQPPKQMTEDDIPF